jgi:transposase
VAVCGRGAGQGGRGRPSGGAGGDRGVAWPKRRAKTDRADACHLRELLAAGRLPQCWIPPAHVLECRALLETYHALRVEHTAWVQRVHAVLFHQGAPGLGAGTLSTAEGWRGLSSCASSSCRRRAGCRSPVRWPCSALWTPSLASCATSSLTPRGACTAPGCCTGSCMGLGRSGRWRSPAGWGCRAVLLGAQGGAVCGLDVTVWSSAGKRGPGRLSRQGLGCCAGWPMRPARPTPARRP